MRCNKTWKSNEIGVLGPMRVMLPLLNMWYGSSLTVTVSHSPWHTLHSSYTHSASFVLFSNLDCPHGRIVVWIFVKCAYACVCVCAPLSVNELVQWSNELNQFPFLLYDILVLCRFSFISFFAHSDAECVCVCCMHVMLNYRFCYMAEHSNVLCSMRILSIVRATQHVANGWDEGSDPWHFSCWIP